MLENRATAPARLTVNNHTFRQIPAAALAACLASALTLCSTAAEAQTPTWSVWEKWEGSTTPVSGGSSGGITVPVNHAATANSPSHYFLLGVPNSTVWWSVGRTFTPPAGLECFAYGVRAGAGTFTSLNGALEVIDSDTWTYIRNKPFTTLRDQPWTWINTTGSAGWTSDGGNIFVRMVLFGSAGGGNVHFDDIVVQCF